MYHEITDVLSAEQDTAPEGVDTQAWGLAVVNLERIIRVTEYPGSAWDSQPPTSVRYLALIPNTTSSDYSGSLVDVANRQYFEDTYGADDDYFLTREYGYGGSELYVSLHHEVVEHETYDYLWSDILGLLDYPLASDDIHSELQEALVDEYVVDYFLDEVRELLDPEVLDAYGDDLVQVIYQECVYPEWGEYPYVEGIDGVVLPMDGESAATLLTEHLTAWQQAQSIHPNQQVLA